MIKGLSGHFREGRPSRKNGAETWQMTTCPAPNMPDVIQARRTARPAGVKTQSSESTLQRCQDREGRQGQRHTAALPDGNPHTTGMGLAESWLAGKDHGRKQHRQAIRSPLPPGAVWVQEGRFHPVLLLCRQTCNVLPQFQHRSTQGQLGSVPHRGWHWSRGNRRQPDQDQGKKVKAHNQNAGPGKIAIWP